MPVKVLTTGFGESIPPFSPHNVTINVSGWDNVLAFRAGDPAIFARLTTLYPRFSPWGIIKQFSTAVATKLDLPDGYDCMLFPSPDLIALATAYGSSPRRGDHQLPAPGAAGGLLFRAVDIGGIRLYAVAYPAAKKPGIIGVWQNPGVGVSSRLGEALLPRLGDDEGKDAAGVKVLDFAPERAGDGAPVPVPEPTYLPETAAHQQVRERIVELLLRAPVDAEKVKGLEPRDVYLYPTGMAAIFRLHEALMEARKGTVVGLGSMFHNTWFLFDESPHGFKHFGPCGAKSGVMDNLEAYLQGEASEGRVVSYVFAEFPSNPILVSVDLRRLRELADKYGFVLVVDDTVGSFCNIDVLPYADVVLTSLTKSFSGYANVMGGSVVLSPSSPRSHALLKPVLARRHRNELFAGDAAQLLANSADYLARSVVLNRNAAALADYLHGLIISGGDSPVVTDVLYPSYADTSANYRAVMRPATADFTPGYGCLLAIDFADQGLTRIFFDNLVAYHSPHLGAHELLALPFNEAIWGKVPELYAYHKSYGLRGEQVRVAVGLESEEDTLDTVKFALSKVEEEMKRRKAAANGHVVETA